MERVFIAATLKEQLCFVMNANKLDSHRHNGTSVAQWVQIFSVIHTDLKLYFCDIAGDVIRTRANFSTSSKSGRRQKEEMLKLDALPTELSGEL